MKKFIFIFAFICGTMTIFAQEQQPATQEVNPNAPIITFDARFMENGMVTYDYGTINQGDNGTCYFVFTNTGKEPLIIERASASCGCTVPNPPKYPILMGQKDSISVKYDTKRVGGINKTITVYSNASNNPLTMRIKGNIKDVPQEQPAEETKQ